MTDILTMKKKQQIKKFRSIFKNLLIKPFVPFFRFCTTNHT